MLKTSELLKEHVLYGPETQVVLQSDECTVYKMENHTGEGVITRYPVFHGIELLYNDIHMSDGVNQNKLPCKDVMEINHCREGRFECEFSGSTAAYLGVGDLAINMLSNTTSRTWFPLSHYHGISIVADLPVAMNTLMQLAEIVDAIPIDLLSIRDQLCKNDTCFIMRASDSIQHIFSELYTVPQKMRVNYFKLKVLELFLFLSSANLSSMREKRQYFARSQVNTIREIKEYMTERLDQHITLDELSKRFHISLTSMKLCFKGVYGTSIYSYMQAYRLQTAAQLLRQTNNRITDIAGQVGYKNTSKFSEAFRKAMSMTPAAYRKNSCPK